MQEKSKFSKKDIFITSKVKASRTIFLVAFITVTITEFVRICANLGEFATDQESDL